MSPLGLLTLFAVAIVGAVGAAVAVSRTHRPALDAVDYLKELDTEPVMVDEYQRQLAEPFVVRALRPMTRALGVITHLTPKEYVQGVHKKLLLAGLSSRIRAEEFVVGQVALGLLSLIATIAYVAFMHPAPRIGVLVLLLVPAIGVMAPSSWLSRQVRARQDAIRKDLPDTLDLLAISVEAGMGFEGAIDVVCQHFSSPLAEEFARTLREMELGLPRHEAFQNLKRRTEVPELSNFVLAIMQADALGIPIGRVLRTQATEMRAKRRQWAREKAAKLPVKILFPLVGFIFPSIMVVVLGPSASGIMKALK